MKKKVLIVGEIYSDNLGDGVLCKTVEKIVKEKIDCEIELLDLSAREDYEKYFKYKGYEKIIKKIFFLLYKFDLINLGKVNVLFKDRYYNKFDKQYDVILFAGGQMFMDYFVFPIKKVLNIAIRRNIPVIFHACGAKKIDNNYLLKELQRQLSSKIIKSISVRDDIDLVNKLYLINSKLKAKKTFDTALNANKYFNTVSIKNDNVIGLGVMYWEKCNRNKQINFWLKIIDELNKRNIKWQLFCNGSISDYKMLEEIVETKNINKGKYVQNRPKTAEELVYNISKFEKIISFRLHSHIIAASLEIPSIGIVWENKVKQFFEIVKLEDRCKTINDSPEEIIDLLEKISKKSSKYNIIKEQAKESEKMLLEEIRNI